MTKMKLTWREKWLAEEEDGGNAGSSGEEEQEMGSVRGDSNPESGNSNPRSGNPKPSEKEGRLGEEPTWMDINMVFMIPAEFCTLMKNVPELALGAERAVFEKPENPGVHMKPLFIRGHLDGTSVGHMLIDIGASVNILPFSLFKKLSHIEGELKCTNLSLSGFVGVPKEVKGIICKELMVGSKQCLLPSSWWMSRGATMCYSVRIGYTPMGVSRLLFINALSNGSVMRWRWFKPMWMCASP
jgi:hypothetical protein